MRKKREVIMESDKKIASDMIVETVLSRWPQTVPVFLKYKMGCVGCTMASYETLSNAVEIYKLPIKKFIHELELAIETA
jgi:hybrid cluster-associated redox disulfide protein